MDQIISLLHGMEIALSIYNIWLMFLGIMLGILSACCRGSVDQTGSQYCFR